MVSCPPHAWTNGRISVPGSWPVGCSPHTVGFSWNHIQYTRYLRPPYLNTAALPQDHKQTQCKRYFAPGYRHPHASTKHTPSPPKDKSTHSASTPIAFSPRIHKFTVEKFCLLGNGHVLPNGTLLCCPYLTLPDSRTRTSVVGARCLNHLVTDNCCVLQRIRPNSSRPSKNFATCHWHPSTI